MGEIKNRSRILAMTPSSIGGDKTKLESLLMAVENGLGMARRNKCDLVESDLREWESLIKQAIKDQEFEDQF